MDKVYIVFQCYACYEGNYAYNPNTFIDSVWDDIDSAKERVQDLSNEYIEKMWYENGYLPHLDYNMMWNNNDKTDVIFEPGEYEHTSFYIKEYALRSGWTEEHKDLPVYFSVQKCPNINNASSEKG